MSSVSFCHYSSPWWPQCAWMGCRTSSAQRKPVIWRLTNRLRTREANLTAHMNGSEPRSDGCQYRQTRSYSRSWRVLSQVQLRNPQIHSGFRLKALQSVIAAVKNEPAPAALPLGWKISCNWFSLHCFFCHQNDFLVFLGCNCISHPPYFTAGLWKQYLCVCATSPCTFTVSWVQRGNKLCPNRFIIPWQWNCLPKRSLFLFMFPVCKFLFPSFSSAVDLLRLFLLLFFFLRGFFVTLSVSF